MPGGPFTCRRRLRTRAIICLFDGFFADQNGTNFDVDVDADAETFLQSQVDSGEGELETDIYTDRHGYVVNGYHLSDHCSLIIKLRIDKFRERVNKADIVKGTRTRRKSTKLMDSDWFT
jgi:hypothetical protein